ncbi:hypothetical protein ACJ8PU_17920 [Serratia sp. CY81489]|uniref:hypothetical protein n=2 Tax=Serratia TaxID=613 RepID=UPI000CAB08FB|nr:MULTISPECIES: hypothetical protein [Serratia]MXS94989.1 hypothetical protein [Serratia marcescens]PKR39225.1 hypothetical protein CU560_13980 [Serratia ureilytica]QHJ28260.1 hypothetical protein GV243_21650 [Serratia marcescens]HAV2138784.1 hypothetical protein [Serratia marcescens]
MFFLSKTAELMGNTLNYMGKSVSQVVTDVSNVASNLAHDIYETTSNLTNGISEIVKPVPILSGVTDAAKLVVDGTVHGAEIVVDHFDMWVAEAGQAVGTLVSTTGDVIANSGNLDIHGVIDSIKDGVGTIVQKDIQFLDHHLTHDLELLQIPGEVVGDGLSSILTGVLGDNIISNAPKIINELQHSLLETGLHEGIINPLLDIATKGSELIFGEDLVPTLKPDDMGMGSFHHGDHGCEIQVVGVSPAQLPELTGL